MANDQAVIVFPTPAAIDAAWERYRALAAALVDHPQLAMNRTHMEDLARAQRAWSDAFLAQDKT